MELKEILKGTPGLQKRFVYYLESQGYITPRKVPKTRIARRDYSDDDMRLIQEIWRYYQRGYAVHFAHSLATRQERTVAYLTFAVPTSGWREVVEMLRGLREVVEVTVVHGGEWNVIIKTDTAEQADVYHALVPALAEARLSSMPKVFMAREQYVQKEASVASNKILAYVLMKVPGKHIEGVAEALRAIPQIAEISVIYGESDIIAKIEAASPQEMDDLVMNQIHSLEQVESTRTFIAVSNLHWTR